MKRADLHIRDPFVVVDRVKQRYILTGTVAVGYDVFTSSDLEIWEGPIAAYRPQPGFWADREWWAPEIHEWKGSYYLFGSIHSEKRRRGTQIFKSANPDGPFAPISQFPVTPTEWECLDGSLYVDKKGKPWIVFCHEWVQVGNGEVCAMPLSDDLSRPVGAPVLLFRAGDAKWCLDIPWESDKKGKVTDGCFLHRLANGHLIMLWSSFAADGYCQAVAHSLSGEITGPWVQERWPIYTNDGGHGMIFTSLKGQLTMCLHQPNSAFNERPLFLPVVERGNRLIVAR